MELRNPLDDYATGEVLVWVLVAVGALNWGLVEQFDYNLVTELLPGSAGLVYVIIGLAAAINLVDLFTDENLLTGL